ncbi:hypothetical protein V2J09_003583 [Rumex salicifolius]
MAIVGNLTPEQLQSFNSQGFLVLESFASAEEVDSMRKRMDQLLDDFDCSNFVIFSTKDHVCISSPPPLSILNNLLPIRMTVLRFCNGFCFNINHAKAKYFFDSAENISFFFEEKAFNDDGSLKQTKQLSINKVGHALHDMDPVFQKVSGSEKVSSMLHSLGYKRPVIIQSMYIFKQPGIGGEVVPHQDNSFLYTEPTTCTGLWLALEDATTVNGCVWAIPGSHKNGLVRRFIRDDEGVTFDNPSPNYDPKDFVPLEVKAGSLLVIHGDLIHQSFENQSPSSRHAYSLHVVDTEGCKWAEDNWIRRERAPEPLYTS